MLISRTPLRISFVGGGSDLPSFYRRSKGAVLSTSITKYIYISVHPYFHKDKFLFKYSETEEVEDIEIISHPLIRLACKYSHVNSGLEFSSAADVPAGTGLGSSSSFTVGSLNCLNEFMGNTKSKYSLADMACKIEIEDLDSPIGKQDQFAASFGGFNVIEFEKDDSVSVSPIDISLDTKANLEKNLVCFYVGGSRSANNILKEQSERLKGDVTFKIQKEMVDLVYEGKKALEKSDLTSFGKILHYNWELKKQLSSGISNDSINLIYEKGIENGALGGKLLGAGGTGFLLFYCESDRQYSLIESLGHLKQLNFKFDTEGSTIIYRDD